MALLNLTQAAAMAGISRVTLNKHLRYGKKNGSERVMITTVNAPDGSTRVDSSEILRVYGDAVKGNSVDACKPLQPLQEALQRENALLREQIQDYRQREQRLLDQVDRLTEAVRMIEHRPVASAPVVPDPDPTPAPVIKRPWWRRIFPM